MPEEKQSTNQPQYISSSYEFGIDEKRRVQFPSKWRKVLGGAAMTLMLWKSNGTLCLQGLLPESLERFLSRLRDMPFADPKAEAMRRILGANSDRVILDRAHRICLPENLARDAGLGEKALLIGMFDRFQIWDPQRYRSTRQADDDHYPEGIRLFDG